MTFAIDLKNAEAVSRRLEDAAAVMGRSPHRSGCIERLPRDGHLLVTGDLHDNPVHLDKVLHLAALDQPDRHVVLHELIHGERLVNGMDFSHRILVRVADLVIRYPGQVHPLLANHELSQMTGAAVSKGAGNSVQQFDDALAFVYGEDWTLVQESITRFIAAMPLALFTESGVCCAHSLPGEPQLERFDRRIIERELKGCDYLRPNGAAYMMTWGRAYTDASVAQLAESWNVRLFCLGHQHVESGIEARGERVLVLNTDHVHAMTLRIDLANDPPAPDMAIMSAVPLASIPG